jgi:glutathione S-transferase
MLAMDIESVQKLKLVTIPASHYCEKIRWVLERLNILYIEEPHAPLFYQFNNRKYNAGKEIPVLLFPNRDVLIGSNNIIDSLNANKLINLEFNSSNNSLISEINKYSEYLDKNLGFLVAHWVYYHLLDDYKLIRTLWCKNVPIVEKSLFLFIYPMARYLFKHRLNIKDGSDEPVYRRLKKVFEDVSCRLSDGRSYLFGDKFSMADLTFSSLAAPALLTPNYRGVLLPNLDEIPGKMSDRVRELRSTPAGKYAMQIFLERSQIIKNY